MLLSFKTQIYFIIIIIIKFWYKKDNVLYNQIITNYKLFN